MIYTHHHYYQEKKRWKEQGRDVDDIKAREEENEER